MTNPPGAAAREGARMTNARTLPAGIVARALPALAGAALLAWLAIHAPVPERADHNVFADQRGWMGVANAGDVLSNLAFLAVGIAGLVALGRRLVDAPATAAFLASLLATAAGSAWYHWAPDDARLLAYRLPNALLAMSLLAAVLGDGWARARQAALLSGCLLAAVAGTAWSMHSGDLRAFLATQLVPFVVVIAWQWTRPRPAAERAAFTLALAAFVASQWAQAHDRAALLAVGISGHTFKHLLAAVATALIARALVRRARRPTAG